MKRDLSPFPFHSPKDMEAYVRQFIIGQDEAVKQLAVPFFIHHENMVHETHFHINTSRVLIGPTGVGKTETLRLFGEICGCPVIHINTSDVTPTGWRGLSYTDILRDAKRQYGADAMKYAVICFSEFDKICHHGQQIVSEHGSDADADFVRDIMKLFEKEPIHIDGGYISSDSSAYNAIDELETENLLIFFDGAFYGIEEIIKKRLKARTNAIGFSAEHELHDNAYWVSQCTKDDLIDWGFNAELMGRIGSLIPLNPASEDMIYRGMTKSKESAVLDHLNFCRAHNISLHIEPEALHLIAKKAAESKRGFREVRSLLDTCMNEHYYELLQSEDGAAAKRSLLLKAGFVSEKLNR